MEHPIQSLDSIDLLGHRKDGGVDLVIIVSSFLDDTPEHEYLLKQKIQNYVDGIFSDEFQGKFGSINKTHYTIVLKCSVEPHLNMISEIQAIAQYLNEFHIDLITEM